MKRHMDLLRSILVAIEDCPEPYYALDELERDLLRSGQAATHVDPTAGDSESELEIEIAEHVQLLEEAGLIERLGRTRGSLGAARLTNAGHDFVAMAADESVWVSAKRAATRGAKTLSLEILRSFLSAAATAIGSAAAQTYIRNAAGAG